jgi:hypothetical protein
MVVAPTRAGGEGVTRRKASTRSTREEDRLRHARTLARLTADPEWQAMVEAARLARQRRETPDEPT